MVARIPLFQLKSRILRYSIPTLVTVTGAVIVWKSLGIRTPSRTELSPTHFTPYKISYRQDIDASHYLLELTPSNPQKTNIWEQIPRNVIWSVEIKQPEIMVVRNYTPVPLSFVQDQ